MEKVNRRMCGQNGNTSKEIENLKRKQNTIPDLKSTMTELETSLLRDRCEQAEERTHKLEDRARGPASLSN